MTHGTPPLPHRVGVIHWIPLYIIFVINKIKIYAWKMNIKLLWIFKYILKFVIIYLLIYCGYIQYILYSTLTDLIAFICKYYICIFTLIFHSSHSALFKRYIFINILWIILMIIIFIYLVQFAYFALPLPVHYLPCKMRLYRGGNAINFCR